MDKSAKIVVVEDKSKLKDLMVATPPENGMVFKSSDEAYLFYKSYAAATGFSSQKRSNYNFYGEKCFVTFSCSRNRDPETQNNKEGQSVVKRRRGELGTKCPARIQLRDHLLDDNWTVVFVELEHNHELMPDAIRYFRCHRIIPKFVKAQLDINDRAGISQNRSIKSIFNQTGGYDNCPFIPRDLKNYLSCQRALKLKDGDANTLMNYFRKRQEISPNFYYCCQFTEDGRLGNIFWADARSCAAYKYSGDAVTFDTTYLINRYEIPFAPFVGVNHHGKSILFGGSLLVDERIETYEWLFRTFLSCMDGIAPPSIIMKPLRGVLSYNVICGGWYKDSF